MMKNLSIIMMLLLTVAGCQSGSFPKWHLHRSKNAAPPVESTDLSLGLQPVPQPRFSDVPQPVGLKEDPVRTFVWETPGMAVARLVYTSKAKVSELAQFYLDQCHSLGWKTDKVFQGEIAELTFSKAGKHLVVRIENLGIPRGRRLTLTYTPE